MSATLTRTLVGYAALVLLAMLAHLTVPVEAGAGMTIISLV